MVPVVEDVLNSTTKSQITKKETSKARKGFTFTHVQGVSSEHPDTILSSRKSAQDFPPNIYPIIYPIEQLTETFSPEHLVQDFSPEQIIQPYTPEPLIQTLSP